MTGISYSNLTTQLTDLLEYPLVDAASATPSSDANFNSILPAIINDAEQRIYREIDFLNTRTQDSTLPVTINSRNFTIPSEIVVVESVALIVPNGSAPAVGARVYPLRISVDALNLVWPQESLTAAPQQDQCWYAMLSNSQMLIAPTPDKAYTAEITGVFRPTPMSASNPTTYLGTNFPDLFLAACCVFGFGYFQRDLGKDIGQGNPQSGMVQAWEDAYQRRKQSVIDEERRRRGLQPEEGSAEVDA